jgi:hypothetical protein
MKLLLLSLLAVVLLFLVSACDGPAMDERDRASTAAYTIWQSCVPGTILWQTNSNPDSQGNITFSSTCKKAAFKP